MAIFCTDRFGNDKKLHLMIEFLLAMAVGSVFSFIKFPSALWVALIAFVGAFAFGVWKEIKDSKQEGNHFCVWDLAWDFIGSLGGALVAFLIYFLTWHHIEITPI